MWGLKLWEGETFVDSGPDQLASANSDPNQPDSATDNIPNKVSPSFCQGFRKAVCRIFKRHQNSPT